MGWNNRRKKKKKRLFLTKFREDGMGSPFSRCDLEKKKAGICQERKKEGMGNIFRS